MADQATVKRLEKAALDVRFQLLDLCNKQGIHIGGDMSVCDIMTVIWQYALKYDVSNPCWKERDRFVLSKGHAAAVTSFSQAAIGCYNPEEIHSEYGGDYGRFGMHSCNLRNPYVDVSTGSLGHGFPIAGGIATALKAKGSFSRVYVVMGDGEQAEGSIWEAAMSSSHYKLGNLVAFIDCNGLSFDGKTKDLMSVEPLADKWRAFGWNVVEVNGHDFGELIEAVDALPPADSDMPTVIIGHTVKGHGISFMENVAGWHAGMISDALLIQAKDELQQAFDKKWGEQ
ncbi:MAG TPA: transketolase [Anaerovoracaceae bacterium]|nr:transketolase [Anaerovoracaceae bacterium]